MKICVLICSHSDPIFTKLTIKSLRKACSHELDIHIGIHSNYTDYTGDLSLIHEFKDCHFHLVDEIDWEFYNNDVYRYSRMHVKNLENLFKNVKFNDFDSLLILDNDLHITGDFITELYNNEDILSCLFDDRSENISVIDEKNKNIIFAPKLAIWHTLLSRKTYDKIMQNTSILYPLLLKISETDNFFFDTFSQVLTKTEEWDLNVKIIKTEDFSKYVLHFYGSSFNYGSKIRDIASQQAIIDIANECYRHYD